MSLNHVRPWRNIYRRKTLEEAGFTYYGIGC